MPTKVQILWHSIVSLKHSDSTKSGRACETEPPFTKNLQKAVVHRIAHKVENQRSSQIYLLNNAQVTNNWEKKNSRKFAS